MLLSMYVWLLPPKSSLSRAVWPWLHLHYKRWRNIWNLHLMRTATRRLCFWFTNWAKRRRGRRSCQWTRTLQRVKCRWANHEQTVPLCLRWSCFEQGSAVAGFYARCPALLLLSASKEGVPCVYPVLKRWFNQPYMDSSGSFKGCNCRTTELWQIIRHWGSNPEPTGCGGRHSTSHRMCHFRLLLHHLNPPHMLIHTKWCWTLSSCLCTLQQQCSR